MSEQSRAALIESFRFALVPDLSAARTRESDRVYRGPDGAFYKVRCAIKPADKIRGAPRLGWAFFVFTASLCDEHGKAIADPFADGEHLVGGGESLTVTDGDVDVETSFEHARQNACARCERQVAAAQRIRDALGRPSQQSAPSA